MKKAAIAVVLLAVSSFAQRAGQDGTFLVKPYLQLGTDAKETNTLALLWQANSSTGEWIVEWKPASSDRFHSIKALSRPVALGTRHFVYQATLNRLKPGESFAYRVLLGGKEVFTAEGHARIAGDAPYRFAVFGDCGADSSGQKSIAFETYKFKPDFVFIPGDIVYWHGLANEYHTKFFPVYNADAASKGAGAPLMRSTLFMASVGNHDVAGQNLGSYPAGLAYFYYFHLPLNGFEKFVRPGFKATADQTRALAEASGDSFPRMSNYSFEYGNSYWLVLDSTAEVDWSQPEMIEWVAKELKSAAARKATWRFVAFHHPPFSSSHMHAGDQQMRVLAKTFEEGKVDVVFSGHVHNYQRTYPLKFQIGSYDASKSHRAAGQFTLDKEFDGKARTKAAGVIYLVTGAGGEFLYDKGQTNNRKSWQEFTVQFISNVHSFTAVEVNGETAIFRQVDEGGAVVDAFTVTK